jgi:diphosphomevalonate decarboxylase
LDYISLSEIVRLGAGSATRSLAGGFALWYADRKGRSYAKQIAAPGDLDLAMAIVPIWSTVKTDEAHKESVTSPLFKARLRYVCRMVKTMKDAILERDVPTVAQLAEEDTLNLHAITMTSRSHLVLWEPDTVEVIKEVQTLRSQGVPCWYSMDTGPSVFVNTSSDHIDTVVDRLESLGLPIVVSRVGGEAKTV